MKIQVSRQRWSRNRLLAPASRVSTVNALNFRIIKRTLFAELRNTVPARSRVGCCVQPRASFGTPTGGRRPAIHASRRQTVQTTPSLPPDRSFDILGERFRPCLELSSFLFRPLFPLLHSVHSAFNPVNPETTMNRLRRESQSCTLFNLAAGLNR